MSLGGGTLTPTAPTPPWLGDHRHRRPHQAGSGTLTLTGTNTYTGGTTVTGGRLAVNGSLASAVTMGNGGTLGGSGTIAGLVANGGTLAPGNSIGTLTVNGNFSAGRGQHLPGRGQRRGPERPDQRRRHGHHQRRHGAGAGPARQPTRRSTTYTILSATGGVSGTYSGVTSNFAFLTPSLSYDANNVYLTLAAERRLRRSARCTPNQRAVGRVLDQRSTRRHRRLRHRAERAVGAQHRAGPGGAERHQRPELCRLRQRHGAGRAALHEQLRQPEPAAAVGGGNRVALAEACDVACDATAPALWGAWGGALGGTRHDRRQRQRRHLTYNVGGFAPASTARSAPSFLAGVTVGYTTGTQWVGGFDGQGVTDSVQAGLYGSFRQGPVYVDALAGYAYSDNQHGAPDHHPRPAAAHRLGPDRRQPVLRPARGRLSLRSAAARRATSSRRSRRLQGSTGDAERLHRDRRAVAQPQRGAADHQLAAHGPRRAARRARSTWAGATSSRLQLRLGWSHEYADTARPVTAAFAGAPAVPFTVFGAAPTRDGAVLGFSANTAIAEATASTSATRAHRRRQDSSHALTAGVRMSW